MEAKAKCIAETLQRVAARRKGREVGDMTDLTHLNQPNAVLSVRVTPKARRNEISLDENGGLRVHVTAAPEDGKANAAVIKLLAKALGVAKSRVVLIRGGTSRDKVFRIDHS